MSTSVNKIIKKLPKTTQKKINTRAKELTAEVFRSEVQQYLQTGKSDILTDKEKVSLDKVRVTQNSGILTNLLKFFYKQEN